MVQGSKINYDQLNMQEFRDSFVKQRENVSISIDEYNQRLADIKEYVKCEIFFNSKRQEILEEIHRYVDFVLMMQRDYDVIRSSVLDDIMNDATSNFTFKSKDEKMLRVNGNPAAAKIKTFIDLFNAQIDFLNESKKTLDCIIYGMKYRFEVQKYLNIVD
jgi:hypothetical protein